MSTALIVTLADDASDTVPEKPFRLASVMVEAPDEPAGMVSVVGLAATLKSPATVIVTLVV